MHSYVIHAIAAGIYTSIYSDARLQINEVNSGRTRCDQCCGFIFYVVYDQSPSIQRLANARNSKPRDLSTRLLLYVSL
jgi:hypothetical protein